MRNVSFSTWTATLDSPGSGFSKTLSIPARSDLFVASPVVAGSATHRLLVGGVPFAVRTALSTAFSDSRLVGGGPPLALSVVQLVVANDRLIDVDDAVVSTIEARPVAVPVAGAPAWRGVPVRLDGAASRNPNGAGALTYRWALLSKPSGSKAAMTAATSVAASFTPDAYGLYVAQLIVSDGILPSRPKTVVVEVSPRAPLAAAAAPVSAFVGQPVGLDGSGSSDPDGNALSYAWTLAGPAGSKAAVSDSAAVSPTFTPDVAGAYVATLTVSDAYGVSAPAPASTTAKLATFAFDPTPAQNVALGSRLIFSVKARDPQNAAVTYSVTGAPAGATFDAATGQFSYRPASSVPSTYALQFSATDGSKTATLSVSLTVTGAASGTTGGLTAQVYDAVDYAKGVLRPVPGVAVSVGSVAATSSASGAVSLAGLPAGPDTLTVSAAGAPNAPDGSKYLDTLVSANLVAGVVNSLDAPILLARASSGGTIDPNGATTVTDPTLGVTLVIARGSAQSADGSSYTGQISIGQSTDTSGLPDGFAPCQLLVVSPAGVTFSPPAQLTVANNDRLPPGATVDLWAFDAQLSTARVVGLGTVSADGKTITTTLGGVPGGTLLAMSPRRAGLTEAATQPADMFVPSVLGGGDLATSFSPPGVRQLDAGRGLTFVYHASTAAPSPVVVAKAGFGPNLGLPTSIQSRLFVDGVAQASLLTTDLTKPLPGGAALDPAKQSAILQTAIASASGLSNGPHSYSFLTVSRYACSAVGSVTTGSFVVDNQTKSAFGPGWQLAELQKLDKPPDGTVVLTEGNGRVVVEHAGQAPDFLPDPVYIPINGPWRGAVGDFNGNGRPGLARVGWKDGSLNVVLNKGARQFVRTSSFAIGLPATRNPDGTLVHDVTDIALGDANGDGIPDLAATIAHSKTVNLFYGQSGGIFTNAPVSVPSGSFGGNTIFGDWNADGLTDLLVSEAEDDGSNPDFHPIWQTAPGAFSFQCCKPVLARGRYILGLKPFRFPGASSDSYAAAIIDGGVGFAYADSDIGNLVDQSMLPEGASRSGGRIIDVAFADGSDQPTVAIAGLSKIFVLKWRARGTGNQDIVQTLSLPAGLAPSSVTLAPLAKGNRPSLVVTAGTAGFYVFANDGRGNFATTPAFIATPFRAGIEADIVDFDGDGIADIALNDIDNDRIAIFFGKPHPDGAFVSPIGDYTRLVQNPDGTYSRLYNDGTKVAFDASGSQTAITDANGNRTQYFYDAQGRLDHIVDPTAATTQFTYSGAFLASVTDGTGRTTSFEHDAAGNLTKVTDPLGNVTQYLYDAASRLVATIDPNGGKTQNSYNSAGKLTGQTYPDGASVKLDVSKALGLDALRVDLGGPVNAAFVPVEARVTQMTDALGHLSETEVNEWGAVVRVTDALGRVSRFTRDAANRVTHSETPAGASTGPIAPSSTGLPQIGSDDLLVNDYQWDGAGNLLSLHEAVGHADDPVSGSRIDRTTSYVYEATHNKVARKTDAEGNVTQWSYDAAGNMTAMTDALGNVTAYSYNAQGRPLTKTDPKGNVTSFTYDVNGNLFETTDALGTKFDRYYDAAGNLILSVDAVGTTIERRRSSAYDRNNRVTAQTDATGKTVTTQYDANGNVTQTIDAAGNVAKRSYDSLNRLVSDTSPSAGTTVYTYDDNNNRLTATDASGAVTLYSYDAVNRLVSLTDAINTTRTFAYDLRDDVVSVVNARGKTTTLGYDVFRRLHSRADPAAGAWPNQYLTRYDRNDNVIVRSSPSRKDGASTGTFLTYDALNRLTGDSHSGFAYDANGNLVSAYGDFNIGSTYEYDTLNRRVKDIRNGGVAVAVTFQYAWDALSRRTAMADSLGGTTTYAYDAEDRVTAITTPWGGQITQSYDFAGRPLRLAFPNGLDADLSFENATGRLAGILHRPGTLGAPIASFGHGYDIRGNLSALTELSGTKSFAYDRIERLTGVTQTLPAPPVDVEAYAYDAEGNRQVSHLSPAYVTDDADRVLDDGTNAYTWSMDGDMTARTPKGAGIGWRFASTFDASGNRMRLDTASASDGSAIGFYYDPLHRLVAHHWPSPRGNDELYYDGPDVVLELRHTASGAQWNRYVHGPGADQPLATESYAPNTQPTPGTGSQYYYHADGEGSIRLLTDSAGQVANRYDYDSYGRRLTAIESLPLQPYGWKGREWVPGPDIYYNRARFYDPLLGRFMSPDPLGYGGGDWNLYSFGWNSPTNQSDPTGKSSSQSAAGGGPATEYAVMAAVTTAVLVKTLPGIACGINTVLAKAYLGLDGFSDIVSAANCSASGRPPQSVSALPYNLLSPSSTHDPGSNSCDYIARSSEYYTYTIYTKAGTPIYVGKGTGDRVYDSLRNKLAQTGGYISCLAASDEQDAYNLECDEILALGGFRDLNPASPLINIRSPSGTNCRFRQMLYLRSGK